MNVKFIRAGCVLPEYDRDLSGHRLAQSDSAARNI